MMKDVWFVVMESAANEVEVVSCTEEGARHRIDCYSNGMGRRHDGRNRTGAILSLEWNSFATIPMA